jgi:hypothetical protein
MRRLALLSMLLACTSLLLVAPAQAITISFSPVSQQVNLGSSGSVDIVVSNRGGVEIGAFAFDVVFNPAIISATSVTFGTGLGDPTDPLETLVAPDVSLAGRATAAEVSFLDVASLLALQTSDSFVLATVHFNAVGTGVTPLTFANVDFSDGDGNTEEVATSTGSVTVVPEPGSLLLLVSGIAIVLPGLRRHRRR